MKRSILLALVLVGCQTAYAQPRHAPRRAPPADASSAAATPAHAADASAPSATGTSTANVLPLSVHGTVHAGWQPRCTATRGCPAMPAIPRCTPGLAARSFADVIDQRLTLAGHVVAVRAALEAGGGCTEMACPENVCCNHCSGSVYLTGTANSALSQIALDPGNTGPAAIARAPDPRFACTGDDSGLCCGTDARGQQVVAQGVLRMLPNGNGRYYLENPTLCLP